MAVTVACSNADCKVIKKLKFQKLKPWLCTPCYRKRYQTPSKKCTVCHKIKPVKAWKKNRAGKKEKPICADCYHPPKDFCGICDRKRSIVSRKWGYPACKPCYNKYRQTKKEFCDYCKITNPVHHFDERGRAICPGCLRKSVSTCSRCGQSGATHKTIKGQHGSFIGTFCPKCSRKLRRRADNSKRKDGLCVGCDKIKPIVSKKGGLRCRACYSAKRRKEGKSGKIDECTGCEKRKIIHYRNRRKVLCANCNGKRLRALTKL